MSDIFISYARQEFPLAEQLANALEAKNFSVWWDRQIRTGVTLAMEVEKQLDQANSVVVLWSENSIKSDWVKDEAAYARELNKLIPVIVEDVTVPFEFRALQSIVLAGWNGDSSHPKFKQLVERISDHLKQLSDRNDNQMLNSS